MKKNRALRRAWFLFEPGCLILCWENSLFPETLHLFPSHQEISEANQTLSAASLLVIMLPLPIQRSLPRRHFLIMVVSGISIFGNSSNEFRSFFCQLFSSSQRCFPIIKKIFIICWYHGHQGCISCGTCSYPELTEDHVLTSAYVKIFRTVTRNAVNKGVWRKKRLFLTSLKQICN